MNIHSPYWQSVVFKSLVMMLAIYGLMGRIDATAQPLVTLTQIQGEVLISGILATEGMIVSEGVVIETLDNASVVLELSDGSQLELTENSQLDLASLLELPDSGARVSKVKLGWGTVRAALSPGHQKEGSSFDIETPNALAGIKFSHPEVDLTFDRTTQISTGNAHTVDMLLTNLNTGESILIPAGQSGIVQGSLLQLIPHLINPAEAPRFLPETTPTAPQAAAKSAGIGGLGTGTVTAIGVGAAAAIGGGVYLATRDDSDTDDSPPSFTGVFQEQHTTVAQDGNTATWTSTLNLVQHDGQVSGSLSVNVVHPCCETTFDVPVQGAVDGLTAVLSWPAGEGTCQGAQCEFHARVEAAHVEARLSENGNTLRVPGEYALFYRQ